MHLAAEHQQNSQWEVDAFAHSSHMVSAVPSTEDSWHLRVIIITGFCFCFSPFSLGLSVKPLLPRTHRNLSASTSLILGLKVCTIMLAVCGFLWGKVLLHSPGWLQMNALPALDFWVLGLCYELSLLAVRGILEFVHDGVYFRGEHLKKKTKTVCVYTHMCRANVCESHRTTSDYHPQEQHPPPLEYGLSLAYSSPIRQDWLASVPQGSISAFPVLGLHVYDTMPAGSFMWVLGLKWVWNELYLSIQITFLTSF